MECAVLRRPLPILNTGFLPAKDWVFYRGVDSRWPICPYLAWIFLSANSPSRDRGHALFRQKELLDKRVFVRRVC
jgi:hypothetical protein